MQLLSLVWRRQCGCEASYRAQFFYFSLIPFPLSLSHTFSSLKLVHVLFIKKNLIQRVLPLKLSNQSYSSLLIEHSFSISLSYLFLSTYRILTYFSLIPFPVHVSNSYRVLYIEFLQSSFWVLCYKVGFCVTKFCDTEGSASEEVLGFCVTKLGFVL